MTADSAPPPSRPASKATTWSRRDSLSRAVWLGLASLCLTGIALADGTPEAGPPAAEALAAAPTPANAASDVETATSPARLEQADHGSPESTDSEPSEAEPGVIGPFKELATATGLGSETDAGDGDGDGAQAEDAAAELAAHLGYSAAVREWRQRVELVELGLVTGASDEEDIDSLFGELSAELWPMQASVHRAIHADADDLIEQHAELVAFYELRSQLFPRLGRRLRIRLTGLNPVGRAEAAREFDYFSANIEYQQHNLESGFERLAEGIEDAPFIALGQLLHILLIMMVFRWWRRWARTALPEIRQHIIDERPRRPGAIRRARMLWYFDRMRRPLEWLALAWVISGLIQPPGFEEISMLIRTIIKWLFIGAATVSLIGARADRTARRRTADTARLRMRSLRTVGYWGVLLGLGLDLTDRYAGNGVLYEWVFRSGLAAGIPLLLLLLHWWKTPIFDQLDSLVPASGNTEKLLARRKGLGSYTAAALGGLTLAREAVLQLIVRMLSGSEFGRRVIAQLVRREVARDGERGIDPNERAIADEIVLPLIAARHVIIEDIAKAELQLMKSSMEAQRGGARAVVGERGAGKTIFLERLAERYDGEMRIIDCPVGGIRELMRTIANEFGIEPGEGFASRLQEVIEREGVSAIGIDNFHRLPRPWLGGQAGLRELAGLIADIASEVNWVVAVDRNAWRYVLLAGGERAMLHETINLPAWTEEQLAVLVEARAEAIDLEPDYEKLVLPRQLDAGERDDEQRNRLGYARVLWELADGNPEVALYLFAESLRRLPDDSVILRLPQLSSPESLVYAHPEALFVLRALVQCDVATVEDMSRSLQLDAERVEQIVRFCTQNGWVVTEHGGHRVSWRWFRSVTRALVRQNLMTR